VSLAPEDYREAASRRLEEGWVLYRESRWEGATYLAGRAAQAMLRSLLVVQGRSLEVGHNLRQHLSKVRTLGILQHRNDEAMEDAVNELAVVWRNDLRFTGAKRFRRLLRKAGRLAKIRGRRIRGIPEKANALSLLNAADTVVSRGDLTWHRSKQS